MYRPSLAEGVPSAVLRECLDFSFRVIREPECSHPRELLFEVSLQSIPTLAASFCIKEYSVYFLPGGSVKMNTCINIYRTFLSPRNKRLNMT